ncbi:MAG: cytochrome c [Chloroflexi bacterium]|nr:cytochrome c [Chloroflexota bacterium]
MRRTIVILAAGLLIGTGVAACGAAPAPTAKPAAPAAPAAPLKPGDAARGKQLFTLSCAACHGPEAKGVPGLGKDMTTSAFVKGQSDAQLLDFIKKGRPATDPANTTRIEMPAKGGNPALTDAELTDMIAYIRSLQQ